MLSGRWAVIGLGAVAMLASMLLQKKQYPQVAIWKMFPLTLWLTITGVLGTMILAYIETGEFGGTSFSRSHIARDADENVLSGYFEPVRAGRMRYDDRYAV